LRLSALFSLDSLGGGFVVQSLLALWLYNRFDLSVETAGVIFFVAGLLSAFSQLVSAWLAQRIGLVRTMVYTHIPANIFLILTALMPTLPLAIATLLMRMALSQMDVPARQSYVMAMVPPEERAAAASVTNVPRSLASAAAPALSGYLLGLTNFGWPLIIGGLLKITYDLLLLGQFASQRPPEELVTTTSGTPASAQR
jgi:MFS family permease